MDSIENFENFFIVIIIMILLLFRFASPQPSYPPLSQPMPRSILFLYGACIINLTEHKRPGVTTPLHLGGERVLWDWATRFAQG